MKYGLITRDIIYMSHYQSSMLLGRVGWLWSIRGLIWRRIRANAALWLVESNLCSQTAYEGDYFIQKWINPRKCNLTTENQEILNRQFGQIFELSDKRQSVFMFSPRLPPSLLDLWRVRIYPDCSNEKQPLLGHHKCLAEQNLGHFRYRLRHNWSSWQFMGRFGPGVGNF